MVDRVIASEACELAVVELKKEYGELLFYQSGGCCDGSTPMCYRVGELTIGPNDILLGYISDVPFYISTSQYEYWKHTQLVIDLGRGGNDTFSLVAPDGRCFVTQSRFFTDEEWAALVKEAPPGLNVT